MVASFSRDEATRMVSGFLDEGAGVAYYHNVAGGYTWLHAEEDRTSCDTMFRNMARNPHVATASLAPAVQVGRHTCYPLLVAGVGDDDEPPPASGMHVVLSGTYLPATPYYFATEAARAAAFRMFEVAGKSA